MPLMMQMCKNTNIKKKVGIANYRGSERDREKRMEIESMRANVKIVSV